MIIKRILLTTIVGAGFLFGGAVLAGTAYANHQPGHNGGGSGGGGSGGSGGGGSSGGGSGGGSSLFDGGKDQACTTVGGCTNGSGQLTEAIRQIVNILSILVGIIAVIMIIYNGFRFITSGGDSGNITAARSGMIYAIVGLIFAALAQVIVRFVLSKVQG